MDSQEWGINSLGQIQIKELAQFLTNSSCWVLGGHTSFIRPHWGREYHISVLWLKKSLCSAALPMGALIYIFQDVLHDSVGWYEAHLGNCKLESCFCSWNFILNFDCTSTIHSLDKELLKCKLASEVAGYGVMRSFGSILVWLLLNFLPFFSCLASFFLLSFSRKWSLTVSLFL